MNVRMRGLLFLTVAVLASINFAYAKPIKNTYAQTENGKMPAELQMELAQEVVIAKSNMSQEHYAEVIADPQTAKNDQERLAGLSAREVFVLVDRSGSMASGDDDPTGRQSQQWSRWQSAEVATESIAELALTLDRNSKVDVTFWTGDNSGKLNQVHEEMTNVGQIKNFFKKYSPGGSTPLAEVLEDVYQRSLHGLLQRGEPFTVIILTDGCPNDPARTKKFFHKVVKENNLEAPGRETLAAFSFVRMGDDPGAMKFLEDLDDNLIKELSISVDIVDSKEDNFLFGTGKYFKKEGVGPLALFWDALYD